MHPDLLRVLLTVLLCNTAFVSAQSNTTNATTFVRRLDHGSISIGDFVYIDGGRVSQSTSESWSNATALVNNVTLSLDMRTSWTNDTVELRAIDRSGAPVLNGVGLWADSADDAFYTWAGSTDVTLEVSEPSLWKFSADGAGGGSWAEQTITDTASFNNLARPAGGYSATSNNAGIYVGGYVTSGTDADVPTWSEVPNPGLVTHNFTTGTWTNTSADAFTTYGAEGGGAAADIPFGPNGLVVMIGGEAATPTTINNRKNHISFSNITFYDPVEQTWYSQIATGDIPVDRDGFCMTGAAGQHGTYELFVFAGWNAYYPLSYGDVHVLSLPAFRWFSGPESSQGRVGPTCQTVGTGNRQMLVVGGHDNGLPTGLRWSTPDPWKQGLAILDMTELSWSGSYNASAATYESPQVVQDWYHGNNSEPDWTSDTVKSLFEDGTNSKTSATAKATTRGASSAADSASASHGTNVGAVAGGVVGGVAGVALTGALLFSLRRKRVRAQVQGAHNVSEVEVNQVQELRGDLSPALENSLKYELPEEQVYELPDDSQSKYEMADNEKNRFRG